LTRLVICRHAPPADDVALDALGKTLEQVELSAVYTSPLDRASTTAAAVAAPHALKPVVVDDLREIDFGDVAGLEFEQLPVDLQRGLLERPAEVGFPGGESFVDVQRRVVAAVETLVTRHPEETVVAISHAGAIRAALAAWLRMAADGAFRLDQRAAAVNVVDFVDGTPFVRLVNSPALVLP
jgi:alpha-ribazole phosphatase